MILISIPQPEDAEGISNVIKKSWYATYINDAVGITKEDLDHMYAKNEASQIEALRTRASDPKNDEVCLVAKDANAIIGFTRLRIHSDSIKWLSHYVHPEYVGKGTGMTLWNEVRKLLPAGKPITVEVATYTRAVNFYTKIGFVDMGAEYRSEGEKMLPSGTKMPLMKMILSD